MDIPTSAPVHVRMPQSHDTPSTSVLPVQTELLGKQWYFPSHCMY